MKLYRPERMWLNDPKVFYSNGQYHLFHLQGKKVEKWEEIQKQRESYGHAVSEDCLRWRQVETIIKPGKRGEWDDKGIWTGDIIEKEGVYYLLYTGVSYKDRIQRLPNLLNEVHRFIEEKKLNFILTGSSARKLKKTGINLLAGRALFKRLYPFLPSELGLSFNFDTILTFGSIPLIWNAPDKKESLKAYVRMYLKEEIKGEALVRNLPGFARFLPVAAVLHGQVINVAGAARNAEISRTTLNGYIEILEDTLLAFRLQAFETKMRIREKKHPKLYWTDPGIVRAVKNRFGELYPEEIGALFEGWIATVLRAYRDYFNLFDEFYYWAPAAAQKTEIDFLLKRENRFIAIEAKSSKKIHREHLKGMKAIADKEGLKRRIVVYMGDKTLKTADNIDILPVPVFIELLDSEKLWSC